MTDDQDNNPVGGDVKPPDAANQGTDRPNDPLDPATPAEQKTPGAQSATAGAINADPPTPEQKLHNTDLNQSDLDALHAAAQADTPGTDEPQDGQNMTAAAAPDDPGDHPAADDPDQKNRPETASFQPPRLDTPAKQTVDPKRLTMLNDVNLRVKLQLGKTRMMVEDVLKLDEGSVIELDKLAGDPVDILVNDRLVGRGEVLILNDVFCVRISEVMSCDPHRIVV